jgi:Fe2+ or Zn2+ uptake regulation protein
VLAALENTTVRNPLTLKEVLARCPSAKREQQVYDALKKYRAQGRVKRIREGREYKYWKEDHTPEDTIAEFGLNEAMQAFNTELKRYKEEHKEMDKPEVLVTDKAVIIISSRIKVTIEY